MKVLSYVPFSSPIAMPVRMFNGDAARLGTVRRRLLLLAVTAVVLLGVGARVYEGSLLRTKVKTSFMAALRKA